MGQGFDAEYQSNHERVAFYKQGTTSVKNWEAF
jgi:hypothetical protein